MTADDIVKAIKKLKPNAEFSMTENDYAGIKWDVLDGNAPTIKELEAALEVIKAEELAAQAHADTKKQEILTRLGITADEAKLLLA